MKHQSNVRLLGLPLIHVATGKLVDGSFRRGMAKGWVAIGGGVTKPIRRARSAGAGLSP
jgi:hypothetical protein